MTTLMRNGRDRRSENPLGATRGKSACFWLGPISGAHQGQQPQRLHSNAGYMAAPERFAKSQILFPCTAGAVHTWHEAGQSLCDGCPQLVEADIRALGRHSG